MRRVLLLFLLAAACAGDRNGAPEAPDALPAAVCDVLENADSFELLSLFPMPQGMDDPLFRERGYDKLPKAGAYVILGKTELDAAQRAKILGAFYEGIADSDGTVAACFNPRHALRAKTDEHAVEVIICFECLSMNITLDGDRVDGVLTTSAPASVFNGVLKGAGVPLPDR